jgi:hypothetical protein
MANATTPVFNPGVQINTSSQPLLHIDTSKTLAAADSGVVQNIVADGLTITLPASASILAGFVAIIRAGGFPASSAVVDGTSSNGTFGIVVTPAAGDGVTGGGWTAAINKGVTCTKATMKVGDTIVLQSTGANTANAWTVLAQYGASWGRTA